MTVQEALRKTQGRGAGAVNRSAVRYAETLLTPGETVTAAVIANVATRREHFPGVVVLTDRRIFAACSLPGIRRTVSLRLDSLRQCEERSSFLNYKAAFSDRKDRFALTVDPETGERFSRCLAVLNGTVEEFDTVREDKKCGILNPLLIRNLRRKRQAVEREKASRKAALESVNARFEAARDAVSEGPEEDAEAVARRLNRQLTQAREQGAVVETDPLAVAARLAEELARENGGGQV